MPVQFEGETARQYDFESFHVRGDAECGECFKGSRPCDEPECKGVKHAQFEDESYDSVYCSWLCDVCGDDGNPA